MIAGVGEEQRSGGRGEQTSRLGELGCGGWAAIAGISWCADSRDRADGPVEGDRAYAVIVRVGDVDATVRSDGKTGWRVELGCGRGTAVAGEALRSVACDRRNRSASDATDAVVGTVADRRAPVVSTDSAVGLLNSAPRAGPASPLKPAMPLPAIVVI
jgi:hypothetical protein